MAGRGKGMTLPAWMTKGDGDGNGSHSHASQENGDRNEAYDSRDRVRHRDRDGEGRGRNRENDEGSYRSSSSRRKRSRSRSAKREQRRDRSKSRSREREKREDEPRRRREKRRSNFDVKPPGVGDDVSSLISSVVGAGSGVAPTPNSILAAASAVPAAMPQMAAGMQQTRHARRIYVGGIGNATEHQIQDFFNDIISRALEKPGDNPVMTVYINHERCFAFVELKSIELTTACMQLDGVLYKGNALKIRRPNDYNPQLVPPTVGEPPYLNLATLGIISTTVPDGNNKIFIGGLPYHLSEDQVKELLSSFGTLKAFHLVREVGQALSKGYGFCEYLDPKVTEVACAGLNGLTIGDKTLTVRVALSQQDAKSVAAVAGTVNTGLSMGVTPTVAPEIGNTNLEAKAMSGLGAQAAMSLMGHYPGAPGSYVPSNSPTRVLVLFNMVTASELAIDEEYADILEDVKQECQKYGALNSVVIPRSQDGASAQSVGRIFVEYRRAEDASSAASVLSGKKFGDQTVRADFYSESLFAERNFGAPV